MRIVNELKRKIKFEDLNVGDTFVIEDRHYLFMKTLSMTINQNGQTANTIVLNDGSVSDFNGNEDVIPVECETKILREGW